MNEILNQLENINPKSLFAKIEATNSELKLILNKEFKYKLGEDPIIVKSTNNITSIYEILNCRLIELSFDFKTYDVWGNEEDGYQVNDVASNSIFKEEVLIHVPTMCLILSKKDIKEIFEIPSDFELEWSDFGFHDKNNLIFYSFGYFINDSKGKPFGEISLTYSDENIKILDSVR